MEIEVEALELVGSLEALGVIGVAIVTVDELAGAEDVVPAWVEEDGLAEVEVLAWLEDDGLIEEDDEVLFVPPQRGCYRFLPIGISSYAPLLNFGLDSDHAHANPHATSMRDITVRLHRTMLTLDSPRPGGATTREPLAVPALRPGIETEVRPVESPASPTLA